MSKYKHVFTEKYQKTVGMEPTKRFLTQNSKDLAKLLDDNGLLSDNINIFEMGSGPGRNLKYINDLNSTINFFSNDLFRDASFLHMDEAIRDKITFYESDTLSLVNSLVPDFDIDILISSDHFMHIDADSVTEIIKKIKTVWKPRYILLKELFSKKGEDLKRYYPRVVHEYNMKDEYSLIHSQRCSDNPTWYWFKLYKRNK